MRILVLDAAFSQTAYLISELSRAGIESVLAAPRLSDPRGLGRYCREVETPRLEDARYPQFVRSLLRSEAFDLIYPTAEPIQQLLWELPEDIGQRVFPSTRPEQRHLLVNRRALYRFVADLGVPVPRESDIRDEHDLNATIGNLGLPLVMRGTQGMSGEQVRICSNLSEALGAYRFLLKRSPAPPFGQEYLDGRRYLIGGLFENGRMLQWFSQTTLEACPAPAGPTIRLRSVRDPVLTSYAQKIFLALGWDGLACAEFIGLGPGDYRFLEINPRPWAAVQAAHTCGVPLLEMFAQYLLGRLPGPAIEFPADKECTLFPAFLSARIRNGSFPKLVDIAPYRQALAAAPWTRPALMRAFLRTLWWTYEWRRSPRNAESLQ